MKKKPVNSRAKGAHGEREASKYLKVLGFNASRNGRNGYSSDDLIVSDLPNVHIEVKFGVRGMDLGTRLLMAAYDQSYNDSLCGHPRPVVLWKPTRKPWRLTWMGKYGLEHTTGDAEIRGKLLELNKPQRGGSEQ